MRSSIRNSFPRLDPPGVSRIAIVIEQPHLKGVGPTNHFSAYEHQLLYNALSGAGIVMDQCFIGAVCQTPAFQFDSFDWNKDEVQSGIAQLRGDLAKFNPSMVLCLGSAALHLLKRGNVAPKKTRQKRKDSLSEEAEAIPVGNDAQADLGQGNTGNQPASFGSFLWPDKIGSWRGSLFASRWIELADDDTKGCDNEGPRTIPVKCLSTLHPSAILRDFSQQALFKFDVARLAKEAKTRELELPERDIVIAQKCDWMSPAYYAKAKLAQFSICRSPMAIDIEGHVGNMTCIALSCSAGSAEVIPFAHADGTSFWTEDEEVEILEELKLLLENPEVPKVLQNGLYDAFVLAWTYGIVIRNFAFDTMVGFWECFAEIPKGLATQASILTNEPFYKPDKGEEGEMKFGSDEEFWRYNGLDACVTLECHEAQMRLMEEGQKAHYAFNMSLMPALLFMEIRGMKWDSAAAALARQDALKKAWELQAKTDEEACFKEDAHDNDMLRLRLLRTAVSHLSEPDFVSLVCYSLCQKNIKRPVEIVEERWQPMKWNGKKWVKDGKSTDVLEDRFIVCPEDFFALSEAPAVNLNFAKKLQKVIIKNLPFTPLTLADCEEFVLESKKEEWKRTKEIWNELKARKGSDSPADPNRRSDGPLSGATAAIEKNGAGASRHALLGELSSLLSLSVNVGSTQEDGDAQRFLYEICGFKEQFKKVKGKKTDKVSTDQNALVKLYGNTKDVRVLWVLQLRRLRKLASDLATEVDADGRIRSTFSLVKETGRMSASESPTGTGTNLQALNKDLRYLAVADEGHLFRQRDLEGADSWTVACECAALGDATMLEDLRAGLKPAQALCVIFSKPESATWSREQLKAAFKENKKEFSKWMYHGFKRVTHGTAYGMGIPTMVQTVLRNSMADLPVNLDEANPIVMNQREAEAFRATVLRRYPGLLKWHQKAAGNLMRDGLIRTSAGHMRRFYGRKKEFKNGQWVANHDTLKEYLASLPQFITTFSCKLSLHAMWHDRDNNPGDGQLHAKPAMAVHDSILYAFGKERLPWIDEKDKEWFGKSVEIAGINVVIPTECQTSTDWSMK